MPRSNLFAVVIAFCAASAQAQYQGGSPPRGMSPTSPNTSAPAVPGSSSGSAPDLQNAMPTAAECDRLMTDRTLKSGGLINEDMKAKVEQCKRMKNSAPMPR